MWIISVILFCLLIWCFLAILRLNVFIKDVNLVCLQETAGSLSKTEALDHIYNLVKVLVVRK